MTTRIWEKGLEKQIVSGIKTSHLGPDGPDSPIKVNERVYFGPSTVDGFLSTSRFWTGIWTRIPKPTIRSTKTQRYLTTSWKSYVRLEWCSMNYLGESVRNYILYILAFIFIFLRTNRRKQSRSIGRSNWSRKQRPSDSWTVQPGPLSLIIILSIFVYLSANFVIWQYLMANLTRFLIQVISFVVYHNPFDSIVHVFCPPSREIKTYLKSCMIFS